MLKKIAIILIVVCVALWSQLAFSQLVQRNVHPYTNYGWSEFKNYQENQPVFPRYDYLGNYLLHGFNVFTWEEYRSLSPNEGSLVIKDRYFKEWMRQLVIANDSFGAWSSRFAIGEAIRTTFTPLTLDLVRLNGIRFDLASDNHKFTSIYSRVSDPVIINPDWSLVNDQITRREDGVFLFGGHWESKFLQDHLLIGGTLVNMYRFDSLLKLKDNSYQGTAIRDAIPDTILVKFSDDSPEDGMGGAAIYSIYAMAKVKTDNEIQSVRINPRKISRSSGVATHYNYLEASGEHNVGMSRIPVAVTYSFPMPQNTIDVQFVAMVANDYRISIRQSHHHVTTQGVVTKTITVTDQEKSGQANYPFFIVRRAEGNVRDMSNKGIVHFSYGMLTGLTTVGLNMELNLIGFNLRGEYNWNYSNYQYPVSSGGRSQWTDVAYYLTLTKDLKPLTLGTEIFSIGPKYNTYASKGPFWYFNEVREIPTRMGGAQGYNNVYPLVDDNDDNDFWPDDWRRDYYAMGPREFQRRDNSGIFPGLDQDQDQWPDYNANGNNIPDWDEPFLQYFVDPIEFQYGADHNNNFIIDIYEDDLLPNYPYYKDERGQHYFSSISLLKSVKITLGAVDIRQIAGGGINKMKYGTLNIDHEFSSVKGKIWYEHQVKHVKDNIRNDWYEFTLQEGSGLVRYPYYVHTKFDDHLTMKNSLVHRGCLIAKFQPIKNLNIENKVKYEFNFLHASEFEDGTSQPEDRIDFIGLACKVDYKFQYKAFTIMPRIKDLWYRWSRQSYDLPYVDKNVLMPILRVDYFLTPKTSLKMGIQGFPLFEHKSWNWGNKDLNFKEQDFVILLNNKTFFQGFKVVWEIGWKHTYRNYESAAIRDINYSSFFVRIHSGVGTLL